MSELPGNNYGVHTYVDGDVDGSPIEWYKEKFLDVLLKCGKFDRGLDIGCGNGRFTSYLLRHCHKLVAVDCNKEVLDYARSYNSNDAVEYVGLDFDNLEQLEGSFDLFIFIGSFYIFAEKLGRLFELKKMLVSSKRKMVVIIDNAGSWNVKFNFQTLQFMFPDWKMEFKTVDNTFMMLFTMEAK